MRPPCVGSIFGESMVTEHTRREDPIRGSRPMPCADAVVKSCMPTNIRPGRHVAASIHNDGVVLLHTVDGQLFASNRTGARIWQALEGRVPIHTIAVGISDEYGISYDKASTEIAWFVVELERHRLIERIAQ